jgi:hypothetical protein
MLVRNKKTIMGFIIENFLLSDGHCLNVAENISSFLNRKMKGAVD